jgi:arsenite methyltransferase
MPDDLKDQIRTRYAEAARSAATGNSSCCGTGSSCCSDERAASQITGHLYALDEVADLPAEAMLASLGCGNPTALAEILPGEVVLDLGSGGGIDVLLSAKRVGPSGKVYGLDMTDEMLALARENQRKAGASNVEFLKGDIEAIPLPADTVDLIISNCVINLATDKEKVLSEAFRVLRPGGRLAVSDVIFQGDIDLVPQELRRSVSAWAGCIAGALEEREYLAKLKAAGFHSPTVAVTRVYEGDLAARLPEGIHLASGFIRARKPGAGP